MQQIMVKICSQIKCIATIMKLDDESTESKRGFYLLSLMLLISLVLLSPDRILQTLSPQHANTEILEKMEDVVKIIKRLVSNLD